MQHSTQCSAARLSRAEHGTAPSAHRWSRSTPEAGHRLWNHSSVLLTQRATGDSFFYTLSDKTYQYYFPTGVFVTSFALKTKWASSSQSLLSVWQIEQLAVSSPGKLILYHITYHQYTGDNITQNEQSWSKKRLDAFNILSLLYS